MTVDLNSLKCSELLTLYTEVISELRRRDFVRSKNNPMADIAEALVVQVLNLKRADKSVKGYDAVDTEGLKYQIKSRRPTVDNCSRQLSFIRDLGSRHFDFLVGLLFTEAMQIDKGCVIPYECVKAKAVYSKHANASIFHLKDDIWLQTGVRAGVQSRAAGA